MNSRTLLLVLRNLALLVLFVAGTARAQPSRGSALAAPTWEEPPGRTSPANLPATAPTQQGPSWATERVDSPREFRTMSDRFLALDAAGRPHIAYGGDALYYIHYDGTTWQEDVVEEVHEGLITTGWYASIALDAAGQPHISYQES